MQIYYPDGQHFVVLYFVIVGAALGMIFDVFKLKRVVFGSSYATLFFDDLLFMLVTAVVLVLCVFKVNSGRLRWYEMAFTVLGFCIYRKTLSVIFVNAFVFVYSKVRLLVLFLLMPFVHAFEKFKDVIKHRACACFEMVRTAALKRVYLNKCLNIIKTRK